MVKFSIVFSYINRLKQTLNTLNSFQQYYGKYDFEVVIVDDCSDENEKLDKYITQFPFPIIYKYIDISEKLDRINPSVPYNIGFKMSKGQIVLIQNPECYHIGDLLEYISKNLSDTDYFTFSCFTGNSKELSDELILSPLKVNDLEFLNRNKNTGDGKLNGLNWYNHPLARPSKYHFCSAIYRSKLNLIAGFDEEYKDGHSYDDDDFILQIEYNLKLQIQIVEPKFGFVIHQFHERSSFHNSFTSKLEKNKQLYLAKKDYFNKTKFDYPRLLHLYWDGSNFSFLNLMTILSFNKHHKFWKIIVHIPIKKVEHKSWMDDEQKTKYDGTDYFEYVKNIKNVVINYVDFNEIGFNNSISEVIKSDYLRYYMLMKHGGVWSDFDIIYINNIEHINSLKDSTVFIGNIGTYIYFPVALFFAKPNSKLFKYIIDNIHKFYDPNKYQCLGVILFRNLFSNSVYKIKEFDVNILKADYYLPIDSTQINSLLEKNTIPLPSHVFGIHWFNGSDKIKKYINELDKRIVSNNFKAQNYLDSFVNEYLVFIQN